MENKELIKGSRLLLYEFERFIEMYDILFKVQSKQLKLNIPITRTAVHESWVVHFRCLIYFLNPGRKDKRDITLSDYLTEEEINELKVLFENWQERQSWEEKANEQLAHITWKRLEHNKSVAKKEWRFVEITLKVNDLFCKFLELANNKNLCEGLIQFKANPLILKYSQSDLDMTIGSL